MRNIILAGILCLLLICSGCSVRMARGSQETTETVIVEGIGPERDRAIEDALKRAVQRVVGVLVQSRSVTEMYKLTESKIMTEALGYVESYRMISEDSTGEQYRVELEAVVDVAKIRTAIGKDTIIISKKPSLRIQDDLLAPDDPSLGAFVNKYGYPILIRVDNSREWTRIKGEHLYFTHIDPGTHKIRIAYLKPEKYSNWLSTKVTEYSVDFTTSDFFKVDKEGQDTVAQGKLVGWKVIIWSGLDWGHMIRYIEYED